MRPDLRTRFQHSILRAVAAGERSLSGAAPKLTELRNLLFLEHSLALGTAIHGTPLPAVLRAALPDARIVAAASGFGLGVLRGNPHLERLVEMPSPLIDLRGAVRALRVLRPFDGEPYAALHTTGNLRTRVVLAAAMGGAATRVGFSVHPELVRVPVQFDNQISQIANNLRIVEALGHRERLRKVLAERPELGEPVVFPNEADVAYIRNLLREGGLSEEAPLAILVTQTSVTQRKSWRGERFRQIAEVLHEQYGAQIVFAGTAGEAAAIEVLRSGLRAVSMNLAGRTNLLQLAAVFGRADIALTLDTGPMHLGRAMGTPMIIVAPAWSPPVEWLPVDQPHVRILKNLTLDAPPADYVIDEVSVAEVEGALHDLLAAYPPGQRTQEA